MLGFVALVFDRKVEVEGDEVPTDKNKEVVTWARDVAARLSDGTTPEQVIERVRAGNCPWDGKGCPLMQAMARSH